MNEYISIYMMKRYCSIILSAFFALCVFILIVYIHSKDHYVAVEHQILTKKEVNELYWMIQQVDHLFRKHGIEYFMLAGTLLGSYRHKGLMPWDDDVDIGIMNTYEDVLNSTEVKKSLAQFNLVLTPKHKIGFGYKIFINGQKYPFIDIFICRINGNRIEYMDTDARELWKMEYMFNHELYPLRKQPFGPLQLYGPNKPRLCLIRWFYPSCLFITKPSHHHKEEDIVFIKKMKILSKREVVLPSI